MGSGGGGGGTFVKRSPKQLREIVRRAEDTTTVAAFETQLSEVLGGLLAGYNDRDTDSARTRLGEIKAALEDSIDGTVDQLLGGSVAKRTYVDGLSDIDSLIIINETSLQNLSPKAALEKMEHILERKLTEKATVTHGQMAVTIDYPDGMKIQLLPAVQMKDDKLLVPSSRHESWSKIDPLKFQNALTRRNQQCGGKLIPTIKLAKAINGQLPESQRLTGYHMESLGIAAFRDYDGPRTTAAMLPTFFERARSLVLSPIRDKTGQSVHVDDYLGPANSEARQAASHVLGRLARRMRNASAAGSTGLWRSIFGLEE